MAGPCPTGVPTWQLHKAARCQDRERCTGPGCRVRRTPWVDPIITDLRAERERVAAADAAAAGG